MLQRTLLVAPPAAPHSHCREGGRPCSGGAAVRLALVAVVLSIGMVTVCGAHDGSANGGPNAIAMVEARAMRTRWQDTHRPTERRSSHDEEYSDAETGRGATDGGGRSSRSVAGENVDDALAPAVVRAVRVLRSRLKKFRIPKVQQWQRGWWASENPCEWDGIMCRQGEVAGLRIPYGVFRGGGVELPDDFFEGTGLDSIEEFHFPGNYFVRMPRTIGRLKNLKKVIGNGNRLQRLPDSFRNLVNLEELNLRNSRLKVLPEWFGELTRMRVLELPGCQLKKLPPSMSRMVNMEELAVNSNELTEVDGILTSMKRLRRLILYANNLKRLPEEVGGLASLVELDVSSNHITVVPDVLYNNTRVQVLDMAYNSIKRLPPSITKMRSLTTLSVSYNSLTELPDAFGELKSLRFLVMSDNRLARIPQSINQCTSLQTIRAERNRIESLPGKLWHLQVLSVFILNHNRIKSLPDDFGHLTALRKLDLEGNRLKALPPTMHNLRRMGNLILKANKLEVLPKALGTLVRLVKLDLDSNNLVHVPNLKGLASLREIHLKKNKLRELPKGLGNLKNLEVLRAHKNKLTHIPRSILGCKKLAYIELRNNKIHRIPSNFSLPLLEELDLESNKLAALPINADAMPLLQKVNVNDNRLTSLPASLGRAPSLEKLLAADNQISDLPDGFFSGAESLKEVDFAMNKLTKIPSTLADLPTLEGIFLQANEIKELPARIAEAWMTGPPEVIRLEANQVYRWPKSPSGDLSLVLREGRQLRIDYWLVEREGVGWVRTLLGLDGDATVDWRHSSKDVYSGANLACRFLVTEGPVSNELFMRECVCQSGYYRVGSQCIICPDNASCVGESNAAVCNKGFYARFKGGAGASNETAVDEEPAMADAIECVACPPEATCEHNDVWPQNGSWWDVDYVKPPLLNGEAIPTYRQAGYDKQFVFTCRNPSSCHGGVNSTCAVGYEGALCTSCAANYYSAPPHECRKCPDPAYTLALFILGGITLAITVLSTFVLTTSMLQKGAWKGGGPPGHMERLGQSTAVMKVLVSFLQILCSIDMTFDVKWPHTLALFDDIFGWVNLDWMRSSAMECLLEGVLGMDNTSGSAAIEPVTFSYYTMLVISSVGPLLVLGLFGLIWLVLYVADNACRPMMRPEGGIMWDRWVSNMAAMRTRCLQFVLLAFVFAYLPVSVKAIGLFNCDSFDGGQTYWIHDDLSVQCYTTEYHSYSLVSLSTLVYFTILFPCSVVIYAAVLNYQLYARERQKGRVEAAVVAFLDKLPLKDTYGFLSRSYRSKYAYWESLDMARKVLIGAICTHFGSSPTFQLGTAVTVSFVFTVAHFAFQPFKSQRANSIAGMNLVLTYLSLCLGLLSQLEVPRDRQSLFTNTVLLLDGAFALVLIALLANDVVDYLRNQVRRGLKSYSRAKKVLKTNK